MKILKFLTKKHEESFLTIIPFDSTISKKIDPNIL